MSETTVTTTPVLLLNGIIIDVPTEALNSLTHKEAAECRAAAVRALLERADEIHASRVPVDRIEYQCPGCSFYVYDEDDELTAAMVSEHKASHR